MVPSKGTKPPQYKVITETQRPAGSACINGLVTGRNRWEQKTFEN